MIGSLRGVLTARSGAGELLVDVQGVGYRVQTTTPTAATAAVGEPMFLFVHTHVREDAIVLYGFVFEDERRCFEALLGAHGVGPALALAVLSALSPAALSTAVLEEDLDVLCAVPGVGRKTAARLLIDLKSRLNLPDLGPSGGAGSPPGSPGRSTMAEVREALTELGYGTEEIRGIERKLKQDPGEDDSVEELLRRALRELASP
jgi:Holliday junction DNA helicase RuvA